MAYNVEAEASRDALLLLLDRFVVELEDVPALEADQMVVVLVVAGRLVGCLSFAEATLGGKSTLGQQLEGPVDGGVPDAGVVLPSEAQQFFDTHVTARPEKPLGDDVALTRGLEALFRQEGVKLVHQRVYVLLYGRRRFTRHGLKLLRIAGGRKRCSRRGRRCNPPPSSARCRALKIPGVGLYTPPPMARSPKRDAKAKVSDEPEVAPEGIDGVLDGLEAVVSELESGELPLEQALLRFEHGVKLARKGGAMLDAVEERVETLLADRDEVAAFEHGVDDTDDAKK